MKQARTLKNWTTPFFFVLLFFVQACTESTNLTTVPKPAPAPSAPGVGASEPILSVASLVSAPASLNLAVGASSNLTITLRDAQNRNLPTTGRVISWTNSSSATASLSATSGASVTVRALAAGQANLVATSEGRSVTVAVVVAAVAPTPAPAPMNPPAPTPTNPPAPTNPPVVGNHMFLNSSEPGCDGSDPNVLLCDDFDDGDWYTKNCDEARYGGANLLSQDGWCGTIFNDAGLTSGTAACDKKGMNSNCAATTGPFLPAGNMADIALKERVDEIYVRFYTKALVGYQFGAEKMLTFNDGNPGDAGIRWGCLSWNCGGSTQPTGWVTMGIPVPMDVCQGQNLGNSISIEAGNWYFYEARYKLSTPGQSDGIFELWLDNCGPQGTSCPTTPTKRLSMTNVRNSRTISQKISVLWFEAWSNPGSRGERYWDQIKASKVGPIGFMKK